MGVLEGWLDGRNDRASRQARDASARGARQQAQGFNLILDRLDSIDSRLDRIEDAIGRRR